MRFDYFETNHIGICFLCKNMCGNNSLHPVVSGYEVFSSCQCGCRLMDGVANSEDTFLDQKTRLKININ
jgi:hypothetical protein